MTRPVRYAAIVLAAGSARRFGSDKLSAPLEGEPLVFHAIRTARRAPVERVIVAAHPALAIGDWAGTPPVQPVRLASDALSTSLRGGLAAALAHGPLDGIFVFLGDMPRVPAGQAARLAALVGGNAAALPRRDGRPGHPVLLRRPLFPAIATLTGDTGAGALLRTRNDVVFDEGQDAGVQLDIDRPEDLAAIARGAARP